MYGYTNPSLLLLMNEQIFSVFMALFVIIINE